MWQLFRSYDMVSRAATCDVYPQGTTTYWPGGSCNTMWRHVEGGFKLTTTQALSGQHRSGGSAWPGFQVCVVIWCFWCVTIINRVHLVHLQPITWSRSILLLFLFIQLERTIEGRACVKADRQVLETETSPFWDVTIRLKDLQVWCKAAGNIYGFSPGP